MDMLAGLAEDWPVSGAGAGRQRRFYPVEKKRLMVEQTPEPGASVAQVAHME
jgi:transposase-like protein